MPYCTLDDVDKILPKRVVIGVNLQRGNTNVLESDVTFYMEQADDVINSYLSSIYRIPLIQKKEPDFSQDPITFIKVYPEPIPLICARLTAASIYDEVLSADQKPEGSDWAKNQRALAFDDLVQIQSGTIMLRGQVYHGKRFHRMELMDMPRVPRPGEFPVNKRNPGQ